MTGIDPGAPGRELRTVWTREVRARLSPLRLSAARRASRAPASRISSRSMVLRDAMMLVGLALVPGLAGALAAGRLLNSMLYESDMLDLPTVAAAMALLCVVALAAAWRPARRAANVDPMVALRVE